MKSPRVALGLIALLVAGCNSISSTMLNRTESDMFIGNSNGQPQHGNQARPFKGVPITVRVPTHVDVAILEEVIFRLSGDSICRVSRPQPTYDVKVVPVYTDKVFTIDLKRPAGGDLDYTIEFGDGENSQYFKALNSKITDQTIQDINAAIQTVVKATTASTGNPKPNDNPPKFEFKTEYRTVAWKRFDLDAVDFEDQIACFVSSRLNSANASFVSF